ncbi:MAG: iron ABC transporter permease [Wenzhouxiangellaceae bacterium]|nr:iron ABC transporter permease [Wenzhouxiangellaceae bacterium]
MHGNQIASRLPKVERVIGTRSAISLAGLALLGALALALFYGTGELAWPADATGWRIVTELRLPRALAAITVGAMLALAGVLMQVLLRNPLADPYVLGVSGGAAAATLAAMLLGLTGLARELPALAGALVSMLLVFALARGAGPWSTTRMLLTGVVVAAGWGALITLMLALGDDQSLRGMLYWLMGDLGYARAGPGWLAVAALATLLVSLRARSLNILATGSPDAALLGEPEARRRIEIYLAGSTLAALAVALAGPVGFVGLIVPHLMRIVVGADHRRLVPAAALGGALFLLVADTLARNLFSPRQLPVGVVTALIGVPVFLVLLHRSGRTR